MNLISIKFGVFLGCILLLYYVVPMKMRWMILLAGSIGFYLLSAIPYTIVYLLLSIAIVYLAAVYIASDGAKHRKLIYSLAVALNVAALFLFKYVNGFYSMGATMFSMAGIQLEPFSLKILAPLGMSFYTLQLIGYLTDVYWGIAKAQKNPAKLTLFAAYFPSISSGPILRYNQVEQTLLNGHKAEYENLTFGLQRMLFGLFKKLIIAERMASIANPIFQTTNNYTGAWLWVGLLAAVLQIYADFSGNMDFILGASECFGIKLPENFRQPFFSRTIQEFWQRWHITLGSWLKDYVMYPLLRTRLWARLSMWTKRHLGKKAAKLIPTFLAMLVLWVINGIWHTPYLKYMLTVLWFWFAVVMGQLLEPIGQKMIKICGIKTDCFSWRLFQRLRTIAVYAVGALFFCASSTKDALRFGKNALYIKNVFQLFSPSTFLSDELLLLCGGKIGVHVLILSMAILIAVEIYENRGDSVRRWLSAQNLVFRWMLLIALIFIVLIFGVYGPGYSAAEFIYAGF